MIAERDTTGPEILNGSPYGMSCGKPDETVRIPPYCGSSSLEVGVVVSVVTGVVVSAVTGVVVSAVTGVVVSAPGSPQPPRIRLVIKIITNGINRNFFMVSFYLRD
jgi:hypothetical protein